MFNFSKTYKVESESFPGVVVTLRRIGPPERNALELKLASVRSRQRELATRIESLEKRINAILDTAAKDDDGKVIEADLPDTAVTLTAEWQSLSVQALELARSEIDPVFVKAAVSDITELTYEGQPATAELVCQYGPESLFNEIAKEIGRNIRLTPEQAENFGSPSTSGARVGGQATNTTVRRAKKDGSISRATAACSSLN
jgi:hypothetical protein